MKILISVDLEGISGVIHPEQIYPGNPFYLDTVKKASLEVNAVVQGLLEQGIKEQDIIVNDSHNHMRNLDSSLMPKACVLSGWQKPFSMVSRANEVDGVVMVGYHCMAGVNAVLSHTYRPRIMKQVKINDIEVGEIGINAALAGVFNVPVIMVTGCDKTCEEAKNLLGDQVSTVEVKKSISRYSALSHPHDVVLFALREGIKNALSLKSNWKPFIVNSPSTISVRFAEPNHADAAELIPTVKRIDNHTVSYTDSDYTKVFKCFLAMGALAASRDDVMT